VRNWSNSPSVSRMVTGACLMAAALLPAACSAQQPKTPAKEDGAPAEIPFDEGRLSLSLVPSAAVTVRDEDGNTHRVEAAAPERSYRDGGRQAAATYSWGRTECRYEIHPKRIDVTVRVTNDGKAPIHEASVRILTATFPRLPDGDDWLHDDRPIVADNTYSPPVARADCGEGMLAVCGAEADRPLAVGFGPREPGGLRAPVTVRLSSRMDYAAGKVIDHAVPPGKTVEAKLSLLLPDPAGGEQELKDAYHAFAERHPMVLRWTDRRPIARLFIARVLSKWETNPRGYLWDKTVDVTTPEGRTEFGKKLLAYADKCIEIIRANGCQGVLIWDIEGQEMPHPLSYIGDPRVLPQIAPEMHEHADAFFKKFTDAGLRVGITIRPTRVYYDKDKRWKWRHRKVADAVREMSDKIAYAQKRWGCTIFYMDSNVGRQMLGHWPWLLPVSPMADLAGRHPDVLIIPEHQALPYWSCMAPYKDWYDGMITPAAVRRMWPDAFSVLALRTDLFARHWDELVANIAAGDVAFMDGWYASSGNALVRQLYRAAAWKKNPLKLEPPREIEKLPALTRNGNPRVRAAGIRAIAARKLAPAAGRLIELLGDEDWLVRRAAVGALGRLGSAESVDPLVELFAKRDHLEWFAVRAMGEVGEPAAAALGPRLKDLGDKSKRSEMQWIVRSLAATGCAQAADFLLPLLTRTDNPAMRIRAAEAVGQLAESPAARKRIFESAAVADLRAMIGKDHRGLTKTALVALAAIATDDALAALQEAAKSDDRFTANQARRALAKAQTDRLRRARRGASSR